MNINLLPHNEEAYEKVMKALETSNRTCIIHPTGTGKSYLIAAVSENYERVLILAPNKFVLNQVGSVTNWHEGIDYMTYQFLNNRGLNKQYDLIVLDEFHRAGATEWGAAVREALEAHKGKILGTTATPIRTLDEGRNMADELFDGNVASEMTIGEAWSRGILPIPIYITGLFDFSSTASEARERITRSHYIDNKRERLEQLEQVELDWQTSQGMPSIIRKHIRRDSKRVIVFCSTVEHMNEMSNTIGEWFEQAGMTVAAVYSVCHATTSKNDEAMEAFKKDTQEGVKIMLAVDMLNEGIHIPRVDAVIMLRRTVSRIIYKQQLGRCLTAANTGRPVVLDMVDNLNGSNVIAEIKADFEEKEREHSGASAGSEREAKRFTVYDYTQELRDVVESLTEDTDRYLSVEDRLEMINDFVSKHDRLPMGSEESAYRNWARLLIMKDNVPRVRELMEKYPRGVQMDDVARKYVEFCNEHKRLPGSGKAAGERALAHYMLRHREEILANYPEVKEQFDKFYRYSRIPSDEERLALVRNFVYENGRFPRKGEMLHVHYQYLSIRCKEESIVNEMKRLTELAKRMREGWKERKPAKPKKEYRTIEECVKEVAAFCEKNGRLPKVGDRKRTVSAWLRVYYHERHPEAVKLFMKYSENSPVKIEERIAIVEEFFRKHNRIPWRKDVEARKAWVWVRTRCQDDPRIIAIKSKDKSYASVNKCEGGID